MLEIGGFYVLEHWWPVRQEFGLPRDTLVVCESERAIAIDGMPFTYECATLRVINTNWYRANIDRSDSVTFEIREYARPRMRHVDIVEALALAAVEYVDDLSAFRQDYDSESTPPSS